MASYSYNVTNSGSGAYNFSGLGANPTLNFQVGDVVTFNVDAAGHPFWIKTNNVTGTGSQYNQGVTNNGVANGVITFTIPSNAPSVLYYQCQFHSSMNGRINIQGNDTTTSTTTTTTTQAPATTTTTTQPPAPTTQPPTPTTQPPAPTTQPPAPTTQPPTTTTSRTALSPAVIYDKTGCISETQRSRPKSKSSLRAGMPIANIISSNYEYAKAEARSSNATINIKVTNLRVKSSCSIKSTMSIISNIGFNTDDLFGQVNTLENNPALSFPQRTKGFSNFKIHKQALLIFNFSASSLNGTNYSTTFAKPIKNGKIYAFARSGLLSVRSKSSFSMRLSDVDADKIAGHTSLINKFQDFQATQKLYPIADVQSATNNVSFVDKNLSPTGLFASLDEGIFTGNYTKSKRVSSLISDDDASYIQPSSIYSEGDFRYKCEITPPSIKPIENFLFIRAAAPMSVLESDIPPQYKIHNIRFEDPSGNLITKYKDINIRGDSNFDQNLSHNFATYVSEPLYNNAKKYNWEDNRPLLNEASGYTLSMDFSATCFYRPFSKHFTKAYEEGCSLDFVISGDNDYLALDGSPLSTRTQGFEFAPNYSLRISNIEIAASGSVYGPLSENYSNLFTQATDKGLRAERSILPAKVLSSSFSSNIHPESETVWKTYDLESNIYYNDNPNHAPQFANILNDLTRSRFIEIHQINGIPDSGKLHLKYEHKPPKKIKQKVGGPWGVGQKKKNSRIKSSKLEFVFGPDVFFEVDKIELHIKARKAVGSRDYALDVVGYSDDKLLNVTSSVGGFLQNKTQGIGSVPPSSGFNSPNELTLSAESISSKEGYFYNANPLNNGGDHYVLTQTPLVTSVTFEDYVIPLEIHKTIPELGPHIDYRNSSYFESLYLDIYPLPSGAAISKADLVVTYKPSNAIGLYTLGRGQEETSTRYAALFVNDDENFNAKISDKPLSVIENIPQAYSNDQTLKTNYSKRWRGVDGRAKAGPFNAIEFDFSFFNPALEHPFLYGYYDFNITDGNSIYSSLEDNSDNIGTYNGVLENALINSVGMRFKSNSLLSSQHNTNYSSIDWTYQGHDLYGKIMDSFDNAVRVEGQGGNINFGNIETSGGFSVFTRFSPDENELFNDAVVFSKWDAGKQLEALLCYKNGYLSAKATDVDGNTIEVTDPTYYSEYQYPVPVLLTYNENESRQLRLYADNEISSGNWNLLRASSAPFLLASGDSDVVIGYSSGSGVGFNGFVTEVGLSKATILSSGVDISKQQIDVERFFDSFRSDFLHENESDSSHRYRMSKFLDEDTTKWHIGAFKYCEFGPGLDTLQRRVGVDYVKHEFYTDGFTYQNDCDLPLPSSQIVLQDLAYHTQLENDMLRLSLDDVNNRFVAAAPRVVKTFPRSYDLATDAIVADTIVEYSTDEHIQWPDGNLGPRLIVSLYTTARDSDLFDTTNWGLINRDIHYLDPDLCWQKLSSSFNLASIEDTETEPWSYFVHSELVKETNHYRYYNDINKMFLQYDLAYPSGSYHSKIKIHSCHVRLEDALHLSDVLYIDDFNLAVSGEPVVRNYLNLYASEPLFNINSSLSYPSGLGLYTSGNTIGFVSSEAGEVYGMPLFSSGAFFIDNIENPLGIFTHSSTGIDYNLNLYTQGVLVHGSRSSNNFGSYIDYEDNTSSAELFGFVPDQASFNEDVFYLYVQNDQRFNGPAGSGEMNLFTELGATLIEDNVNLYTVGKYSQFTVIAGPRLRKSKADINFVLLVDEPDNIASESSNLYIDGFDPNIITVSGSMSLHSININPINSYAGWLESFLWNGENSFGKNIILEDDRLLSIRPDDEIRGVITTCYRDCDSDGNCYEYQLYTHDTLWFDTQCFDGGVIRPITTYTNSDTIGFNVLQDGYLNHFYGTRKIDNLIPGAPYRIQITAQSGGSGVLDVPREISEMEYGTNDDVDYSGVKIVANDEHRNVADKYGHSVEICNDLMAVGAPYYSLEEEGKTLDRSGSIFLYKRDPAPSGVDWSEQNDKSPWVFDSHLTLPYGWLRDYYIDTDKEIVTNNPLLRDTVVTERQYYVGQYGRELGHSLALANNDSRQVLVAGAPGAKWDRVFEDLIPQPVSVAIFIFTDEFQPDYRTGRSNVFLTWRDLLPYIEEKDVLFKYFCDPPIAFDVKVIICEGVLGTDIAPSRDISESRSGPQDFVFQRKINRILGFTTLEEKRRQDNIIFEELKDIFYEFFPVDTSKINNNMPAIAGFYVDGSVSYGTAAVGSPDPDSISAGGLRNFIDWFRQYAYDNGLIDTDGLPAYPVIQEVVEEDETWVNQAGRCINDTLSIESLIDNRGFLLFANNFGTFNENLNEFNLAPPSGGSVYIFENLNNNWEIIQEIQSPTLSNNTYVDRFGHDVAISEDASTIVIGSPYIDQAVQIYQYNQFYDQAFHSLFIPWLRENGDPTVDTNFGELYRARAVLNSRLASSIGLQAEKEIALSVFNDLSPSGKFAYRKLYPDNPYILTRTITHSEIQPSHSWSWLFSRYATTPRLGYSVDVNEDGSTIVMGSPTDSFGHQDDAILWYKPGGKRNSPFNWASNVNAGAIRVLEGRNYYPHTKVVQFGRFGNYHRALSEENDSVFNHYASIYESVGVDYVETEFVDPEIPQDAGTLLIITPDPRVNSLSEEIIQNIKEWLALGDRNLVLVGNDPIWEENGAYSSSNSMINTLLQRLDSRMKLDPARRRYESMVDVDTGLYYNNIPSYLPEKTTTTFIERQVSLRGSGVGDIRLADDNVSSMYSCLRPKTDILTGLDFSSIGGIFPPTYPESHSLCNMPIKYDGDLRAEWTEFCRPKQGRGYVPYKVNIAFVYGTHTICDWPCDCGDGAPESPKKNYEPIPILAAAESLDLVREIPAIPEKSTPVQVAVGRRPKGISRDYKDVADSGIAFIWSAESGNYTFLDTNYTNTISDSLFFDPLEFNNHNGLLQAKSETVFKTSNIKVKARDDFPICVSQNVGTSSSVVLLSVVETESTDILNFGTDENIKLYMNLTDKTSRGEARIGQLGGWTNRTAFASGFSKSSLKSLFTILGNTVTENVDPETINIPGNVYDVLWIANTDAIATDAQIQQLRLWLNSGNKKLVISFGSTGKGDTEASVLSKIKAAENIVSKLDLTLTPYFVPSENKYADHRNVREERDLRFIYARDYLQEGKRRSRSKIENPLNFGDNRNTNFSREFLTAINPIDATVLAYSTEDIYITDSIRQGRPFIKSGTAKVTFPVQEATGYRIFFTTVSETVNEQKLLGFGIGNARTSIDLTPVEPDETFGIFGFQERGVGQSIKSVDRFTRRDQPSTWPITNYLGEPDTYYVDVTVPSGNTELSVYIDASYVGIDVAFPESLLTQRLLSISGAKLGYEIKPVFETVFETQNIITPAVPARQESYFVTREISTDSSKYCPSDYCLEQFGVPGPDIADGPVTVAQEIYHQAPFRNGYNRSRITLISDPSLIQGETILTENDKTLINRDVAIFLQSLYPYTFQSIDQSIWESVDRNGIIPRQYLYLTKLVSPEKSSPAKLLVDSVNRGFNNLFGGYSISSKPANRFSNLDNLVDTSAREWYGPNEPYFHNGPDYVTQRDAPPPGPSSVELSRSGQLELFQSLIEQMGIHTKFKTTINGIEYQDPFTGIPKILEDYGHDYLEFQSMSHVVSGYPGDLFGYKVKIHKDKIYATSPFAIFDGEDVTTWESVKTNTPNGPIYNASIGYYGGAGAVYVYEKNFRGVGVNNAITDWSFTKKIRPDTISAEGFSDKFGQSFDIDGDTLVISAPGHADDAVIIRTSGEFIRKEFNSQFAIAGLDKYDLGDKSLPENILDSGIAKQNAGALYVYENKIADWGSKTQDWAFTQKIVPQGYNARNENDNFGLSVAIDRYARSDSDYALVAGSPFHGHGASGSSLFMASGGAVFTYDAMLRRLAPSFANPESNIAGRLFGDIDSVLESERYLEFNFKNGFKYDSLQTITGDVFADQNGQIFLEVSGQDKNDRGYAIHRPFIQNIAGYYIHGKYLPQYTRFFVAGKPPEAASAMNLFSPDTVDNVYNTLGMYNLGIIDHVSGVKPLNISVSGGLIDSVSNSGNPLFLVMNSGVDSLTSPLDLYVRGKI